MNDPEVTVGQVWKDWDKRQRNNEPGRRLHVDAVANGFAYCTVQGTNRQVRVSVKRFRPTSTGYKLISPEE